MGSFRCWCGYRLGKSLAEPGTGFNLVAEEDGDLIFHPSIKDLGTGERESAVDRSYEVSFFECPNCGRVYLEREGLMRFRRDDSDPPRIWADLSERDEHGRVVLRSARSRNDIIRQKLVLTGYPAVVLLYDDRGEYRGTAFAAYFPGTDTVDYNTWAVVLDE